MAAVSGAKSLPDRQKRDSVSDQVAKSAAEAVERLQRAASTIAADAEKLRSKETSPAPSRAGRISRALAPRLAILRGNWGKAAAASITCAAIAVAAILGLRDGARPDSAQMMSFGFALPWKSSAAEAQKQEQKTQALHNQIQALSEEVHGLRAQVQKQAEESRITQTRAAAATSAGSQASARMDRIERDTAAKLDRVERETASKLEQHATRIDRVERLVADPVVTSSIPKSSANPPAALKAAPNAPAGAPEAYVLRGVHNGVATVQTRSGLIEVGPGDTIPGVGRVRSIEKIDGRWVVVTRDGIIDAE